MQLTCPKCDALMRQYERNSIVIDQCSACRGVFLDRGELEHLIDTEKWVSGVNPEAPARQMPEFQGDNSETGKIPSRRTLLQVLFGE